MNLLLPLSAALGIGSLLGWAFARLKSAPERALWQTEQERARALQTEVDTLETERQSLQIQLADARADRRNLQEKCQELALTEERLGALAQRAFESRNLAFIEQNRKNLSETLGPFQQRMREYQESIDNIHKEAIKRDAGLFNELKNMQQVSLGIGEEARNLTRALKSDTKTQGDWGEMILERILEQSGLIKGQEYCVQQSYTTEDGSRQRPDVIIKLPNQRYIVVDSKVSLKAYEQYANAESEQERESALKNHLASLVRHIDGLSKKDYQRYRKEEGLDFVILFVPIEAAYVLALQHKKDLYEESFRRKILLVSPTLLLPSLKLINNIWKREYQNRNVLEIADGAGKLYDKFVGFVEDLQKVGKALEGAQKAYADSYNKLSEGHGNLVGRVEKLKKLGAKAEKSLESIDPTLLDKSLSENDSLPLTSA